MGELDRGAARPSGEFEQDLLQVGVREAGGRSCRPSSVGIEHALWQRAGAFRTEARHRRQGKGWSRKDRIPTEVAMRITSKGQVTIPASIRAQAGLLPNSEVDFEFDGAGNLVTPFISAEELAGAH